ncbi:MAG: hypothetical protein HOO06_04715, partial [Bdellovibrionaceae bacterium]|nr:hypothetical protein [Pseudobdellovibrionaceae bacterium]
MVRAWAHILYFYFRFFIKNLKASFYLIVLLSLISCNPEVEIGSSDFDSMNISITGGDAQFASVNANFTTPLTVKISNSKQLKDIAIYWSLAPGSAKASLDSSVVKTDENGESTVNVTSSEESGTITVYARIANAKSEIKAVFNLFVNGNAVNWAINVVEGSTVTSGTAFNLHIEALLNTGLPDTDFNGSKYLSFSTNAISAPNGQSISMPSDGNYDFNNGVIATNIPVTFYNSSDSGAEVYTISVVGSSLLGDSTSDLTVLDAGTDSIKILTADNCAAVEIPDINYIVTISETVYAYYFDAYDNCIEGTVASGNWTKTFLDPQATFTGSVTGTHSIQFDPIIADVTGTITVDDGTHSDSTGTITLKDGTADHFLVLGLDSESNFTTTAGTAATVLVEARDSVGNTAQTYNGVKNLVWETTATDLVPPTALALGTQSLIVPADAGYTFVNGILVSPTPQYNFKSSAQTPTITVYDGVSCVASLCATTGTVTVNSLASTHALVRSQSGGAGGNAASFNAAAISPTADDSYSLYCANYDSLGNYLTDNSLADWGVSGVILSGDITPDLVDEANITYNARVAGTGAIYCDTDGSVDGAGIADSTGTFTILPGSPNYFTIDGGSGENAAFSVASGSAFSTTIRAYDSDDNLTTNFTNAAYATTVNYVGSTNVFPSFPSEISPTNTAAKIENTNGNSKSVNLNISAGLATVNNFLLVNDTEDSDEPRITVVDDSASISTATSGLITVNQNVLAHISIRDAASNAGSVVNAPATTTDTNLTFYAAGYDDSGNYIGDQTVDWDDTSPTGNCDNADLAGNPGSINSTVSVIYNPDTIGNCVITAFHASASDTTGSITINNGALDHFDLSVTSGTPVTAGTGFNIKVTGFDADNNRAFNYSPDSSFSLTTTAGNSPEGTAPTGLALVTGDFSFGEAVVNGLTIFDASSSFTLTATETGTGTMTGTSAAISINPNTLHHYAITASAGAYVADKTTNFDATVEARDEWGNATTTGIGALIDLTMVQQSDEALVGPIGSSTGLDLAGSASAVFSGLTYGVSHQAQIVATDSNAVTTPIALRQSLTFSSASGNVDDYVLSNFSTTTPSAGDAFTCTITARDEAGNTITGLDATLGGFSFTQSSGSSTSPYLDAATHHTGVIPFTNGVSDPISSTFFTEEAVLGSSISINDGLARTGDATGTDITVTEDPLNNYSIETSTATPIDADGVATFEANINGRDQYGNYVAGDASINLGVNHISVENAGSLGGTTSAINLSSGNSIINNLTYNVAGTMELTVSGGSVTSPSARSVDYTFANVAGTLDHYDLTFTGPATAGTGFNITVTARDAANNTVDGVDATFSGRTFTWSGINNSPEGVAPTLDSDLVFTNGVATATITFTEATTIALGNLSVDDGTGKSGVSTAGLTIDPSGVGDHFNIISSGFPADGSGSSQTSTQLDIVLEDAFGNSTTDPAMTLVALSLSQVSGYTNTGTMNAATTDTGGLSDITTITPSFNVSATQSLYDFSYDVAHVVELIATKGGVTTATGSTDDLTFNATTSTVNSYTLTLDDLSATAGVATNATFTALDAAGNTITTDDSVLDTISFTFATNANVDAPDTSVDADSTDPADGALTFTSGVVTLAYQFYHAANNVSVSDLTVTDTTNTIVTNNSDTITINAAAGNYFVIAGTNFPANASGSANTSTQLDITLKDDYGNNTIDATITNIALSFNQVSGYTNTGTMNAATTDAGGLSDITTITPSFNVSATQSLYDFSYDVAHVVEVIATSGGVTTASGSTDDLTFNATTSTVNSYTLTLDDASATAGVSTNATLTALDVAGNTITTDDAVLDTINFTFATNANVDAPDSSVDADTTDPADGTLTFTSGVATLAYQFYHATNNVSVSDLAVTDTTNTIVTNNSDTMTINAAAGNYFVIAGTNFPANASGSANTSTRLDITLKDDYGNNTIDAAVTNAALSFNQVSGYTNTGTMNAATTDAGGLSDITTITPSFNITATQSLYDISYDVAHVVEVIATSGGVTTASGSTDDLTFNATTSTVNSYTLTLDDASATAGVATNATLTALDIAGNTITADDAVLDTINFTFATNASVDAPDSSVDADTTDPVDGTLTFTSGVATLAYQFYHATNNVSVSDLTVTDTTNTIVTNNSDTMTINAAAGNYFVIAGINFPADASGSANATTQLDITLKDDYGNNTIDATMTSVALSLSQVSGYTNVGTMNAATIDAGGLSDITTITPSFNVSATQSLYDFSYDVAHVMEVIATKGGVTTASGSTDDLTFNATTSTVNSYTLTLDDASAIAGASTNATLTALDAAGNTITGDDATLDTINFTFATNANVDAPNATQTGNGNDPANGTLTFTSGVATLAYSFFNVTNNVSVSDLTVTDTTNTIVTNNSDTMTINAAVSDHFEITQSGFAANADGTVQT